MCILRIKYKREYIWRNMKIVFYVSKLKSGLFKILLSNTKNRNNYAVSEIVGIVLVLLIIGGTVSTILFWGVPYMQDKKSFVDQENALLQFDAMGDLIDDALAEGVFDVENLEVATSSKAMTFKLSGGKLNMDNQGERFVFWYSLVPNFDFDVLNLNPDGNEYEFEINVFEGEPKFLDVYYLYDNSVSDKNINIGDSTNYPLHDAVKIDVKDLGYNIIGRIWLFDVGSLNYQSTGSSNTYKAVVENGGVLATGDRTSGYFYNEPKFWPQTLLDNSSILTLRIIQIKKDPRIGVDSIGGTGYNEVKFSIRPKSSLIKENKTEISNKFKMDIYGDNDAVSAWRYFFKNRVGLQGDDIDEPLSWVPPIGASKVVFSLTHAICYISMEI